MLLMSEFNHQDVLPPTADPKAGPSITFGEFFAGGCPPGMNPKGSVLLNLENLRVRARRKIIARGDVPDEGGQDSVADEGGESSVPDDGSEGSMPDEGSEGSVLDDGSVADEGSEGSVRDDGSVADEGSVPDEGSVQNA